MKDIPIWVRWNRQEMVSIETEGNGWHTYRIRKTATLAVRSVLARGIGRFVWRSFIRGFAALLRGIGLGTVPAAKLR